MGKKCKKNGRNSKQKKTTTVMTQKKNAAKKRKPFQIPDWIVPTIIIVDKIIRWYLDFTGRN